MSKERSEEVPKYLIISKKIYTTGNKSNELFFKKLTFLKITKTFVFIILLNYIKLFRARKLNNCNFYVFVESKLNFKMSFCLSILSFVMVI